MTPDYRVWFSKADMRVRFALQLPPSRPLQENLGTSELLPGGVSVQLHVQDEKMHAAPSEWRLAETHSGRCLPLPRTMLFLGRDDCDINIPSRSVDKRHAVLTYDGYEEKFRVKDLSSVNGTYVNDSRLAEQEYVTLEDMDTLRFGYDPMVYRMERIDELPHLEQQEEEPPKVMPSSVKVTISKVTSSSPSSSPPPLVTSTSELPQWAARVPSPRPVQAPSLGLAECQKAPLQRQGCIAEQGIRHTCGANDEDEVDPQHHHHHIHHHHPQQQPHQHHQQQHLQQSKTIYVSSNGHAGLPLSPPHPVSYNRWKDSRPNGQEQTYYQEQQTVYTSGGIDHHHHNSTTYSHEQNYRSSAHVQLSGVTVTSPTSNCVQDFTSPSPAESPTVLGGGSHRDGRYKTSPGAPPPLVVNDKNAFPLVDEQELAASQLVNRNGEGNLGSTSSLNTSTTTGSINPSTIPQKQPATEKFQTHFQIIPPRQGQNYRVINVQFTSPNLGGPNASVAPSSSTEVPAAQLSPASSNAFQSLKASLGHFVFMTPQMDDGVPVGQIGQIISEQHPSQFSADPSAATTLISSPCSSISSPSSTSSVNCVNVSPHHQYQPHQPPPGLRSGSTMGAGDEHLVHSAEAIDHSLHGINTNTKASGTVKNGVNNNNNDSCYTQSYGGTETGVSAHGIYSPTTPSSPPSVRHDHRRSLVGTEPELETIKKCTPLYGQPSWWGEESEHAHSSHPSTAPPPGADNNDNESPAKMANLTERPSSLALGACHTSPPHSSNNPAQNANTTNSSSSIDMNKYKTDPRYATTYMEIPQRDADHHHSSSRAAPGIAAHPPHTPPEKDTSPGKVPASPAAEKAKPMAFMVDLGDDMGGAPKLNMKNSLSEFLPHKVRRSFRSRSVKSRNRSGDEKEDSPASGKASRDGSPARTSRSGTGEGQYHSDGGHNSALSSDNEDISIRSDTITTKTRRKSSQSPRTTASGRHPRRDKSAGRTSTSRTAELRKQQTSATSTGVTGGTSEATNYLIERMFNHTPPRTAHIPSDPEDEQPVQSKVSSHGHRAKTETTRSYVSMAQDQEESQLRPHPPTSLVAPQQRRHREMSETSDNISESGTYTIEADVPELKRARQSIDAVFGVMGRDVDDVVVSDDDVISRDVHTNGSATTLEKGSLLHDAAGGKKKHGSGVINNGNDDDEDTDEDTDVEEREDYKIVEVLFDGVWASPKLTRRTPEVHSYQPEAVADQAKEDTPKWVSQWATLATQKTFVKSPTLTTQSPIHSGFGEGPETRSSSDSGMVPRKPRGTGRKLPVPPVKSSTTTSPNSTTAPSSEIFSCRESTVSETSEQNVETSVQFSGACVRPNCLDVQSAGASPRPTAYVDPRPSTTRATVNDIDEMLANSGVTSDVVTFVYDEMTDSVRSEMTDSMTSSHMTESYVEETERPQAEGHEEDNDQEVQELATCHPVAVTTVRPGASIDTEVLLKDTADVVQAMADRVQAGNEQEQNKVNELWNRKSTELFIPLHDDESDSEGSGRGVLNGGHHREMPKFKPRPKLFKSHSTDTRKPPRPFLSREERERECEPASREQEPVTKERKPVGREREQVSRDRKAVSREREPVSREREPIGIGRDRRETKSTPVRSSPKPKTSSGKPRLSTSHSQPQTTPKIPKDATFVKTADSGSSSRSGKQRVPSLDLNSSFGSDLHSESETGSILSTSTDYSESLSPKLARRGSKGKGPMSMTRPNRAFALRRARLEGEPEPPPTPRSQSNTPRSRPNSAGARDTSRSRPNSARDRIQSERNDMSVGAKSMQKHRESSVGPPRAKSAGPRTDTGRYTARHEKKPPGSNTSTPRKSPAPPSSSSYRSKPERISVSNMSVSTGGSRSKPTSRSNSPQTPSKKSEEYSAWKRRKGYDPRQAVVNAKAKAREEKRVPLDRSQSAGPHARTSTFSSVSSEDTSYLEEMNAYSQDRDAISQVSSSVTHQMEAMSRSIENDDAFFQNKLLPKRSSLPKNNIIKGSPQSTQLVGRSNRSAFSVPRTRSVPLSLRSPPPRRLSANLSNGTSGRVPDRAPKTTTLKRPESYDSVMVNSIYQLSRKVCTQTDKLMEKMRNDCMLAGSPSPTEDSRSPPLESEIPGYKNANQELVGILRNLRKTERHLQIIDRAIFPSQEGAVSPASPHDHGQYLRELERIRTEISGFKPIEEPSSALSSIISSSSRSSWRRTSRESDATDNDVGDPLDGDEYY